MTPPVLKKTCEPRKVAIIGVGLLGGSIGLGLRQRWPDLPVVGMSRSATNRAAAIECGCVTDACGDAHAACRDADLVILCTPVGMIAELAIELAPSVPPDAVITDAGSTKQRIVEHIESDAIACQKFVGSHPIAGGEKTGPANARADLFQGKQVVVTPTNRTDPERLARVRQLWQSLGASVSELSPRVHDQQLAGVSHATHFAACATAAILRPEEIALIGSGWRDTTRVAAGDPQMWTDIAMQNPEAIVDRLQAIARHLNTLIDVVHNGERDALMQFLRETQQLRQSVPNLVPSAEPDSDA